MKDENNKGFAHLVLVGVIAAVFIGAAGTAVASNGSKPGDTLYSIDRGLERIQLALAFTDGTRESVLASLANERLDEIEALLNDENSSSDDISAAIDRYDEVRSELDEMFNEDGTLDEHEQEVEDEIDGRSDDVDDLYEQEKNALEDQREALKKQYEDAVESGDTESANSLQTQIQSTEDKIESIDDSGNDSSDDNSSDDSEDQSSEPEDEQEDGADDSDEDSNNDDSEDDSGSDNSGSSNNN